MDGSIVLRAMEVAGDKKSDAWKTAAQNLVKLQREAAVEEAQWVLTSAIKQQEQAAAALKKAEKEKKNPSDNSDNSDNSTDNKSNNESNDKDKEKGKGNGLGKIEKEAWQMGWVI